MILDKGNLALHLANAHQDPQFNGGNEASLAASIELIKALFTGGMVNSTERRAAGHWSLRAAKRMATYPEFVQLNHLGRDEIAHARSVEQSVLGYVDRFHAGDIKNAEGQTYTDILHLGIGGSDLGPRMLHDVLSRIDRHQPSPVRTVRFVANVDYHELQLALEQLDPKRTLVIAASKSFGTRETLTNLALIKQWLGAVSTTHRDQSLVAVTCKPDKARAEGFLAHQIFEFSETVGGRYSLWGPVSLVIRLIYGNTVFDSFLNGAADMDVHTLTADVRDNLPLQAAWSDWRNLQNGVHSLMLSAYDARLGLLVPYLQQLWMESLGKGVDVAGSPLKGPACPILWGDVGTNGQHAFFQMLHQAHYPTAIELLGVVNPDHSVKASHELLLAHALAQAEAFHDGKFNTTSDWANTALNFRSCVGHRPLKVMFLKRLDAHSLGMLLAFWEHRTVALAGLSNLNPFDQWGVELGKTISEGLFAQFQSGQPQSTHAFTQGLINQIGKMTL